MLSLKIALLLLALLFQNAAKARKKTTLTEVLSCDRYASCAPGVDHTNSCFCDRLCRIYADCCPDYVDEEGDHQLTPLSPDLFTCTWMHPSPVYIITKCPATYDVQFVLDGCRFGSAHVHHPSNEVFYVVPVSSRTSGLVYRNVYCAICHGEENVGFWNVTTGSCHEQHILEQVTSAAGVENIEELVRHESIVGNCLFSFTPVSNIPEPRRCVDSVSSCPDDADAEVASRCARASNVVYVYHGIRFQAYRNRDCAACNGISDYQLTCNSSTLDLRGPGTGSFESFAIVLDLNTGKGSAVKTGSGESLRTERLGSCPERHVYDPFASICRAITCPPGHSFTKNGQCQRHYAYRSRSAVVHRPQTTKVVDDFDCAWLQFNASEYQMLPNHSIYIPLHDITYDTQSYHLDDNHTSYVCTPFQRNYTEWVYEALRVDVVGTYLSVICSAISLLALAFQFSVYMAFPVLRNTPGRCVICLVVSLFVGQLLFLLVKTGSSVSPGFCFGQATVMHFAFLAAFFWMNVMAFDVYRTFGASPGAAASSSPAGARRRFAGYSSYAWVSTAVVVVIGMVLDFAGVGGPYRPYYGRRVCWFGSRGGLLVLFGVPVGVLLVANIVMFAMSVRQIRNASKASQMAVQKTDQTQLVVSNVLAWLHNQSKLSVCACKQSNHRLRMVQVNSAVTAYN